MAAAGGGGSIPGSVTQPGYNADNDRDWMYVSGAYMKYIDAMFTQAYNVYITSKIRKYTPSQQPTFVANAAIPAVGLIARRDCAAIGQAAVEQAAVDEEAVYREEENCFLRPIEDHCTSFSSPASFSSPQNQVFSRQVTSRQVSSRQQTNPTVDLPPSRLQLRLGGLFG